MKTDRFEWAISLLSFPGRSGAISGRPQKGKLLFAKLLSGCANGLYNRSIEWDPAKAFEHSPERAEIRGYKMQKITPVLWFDGQAEEAANFYISLFEDGKITKIERFPEGMPGQTGSVMTVVFEIEGHTFVGLNGGPHYKFTPAVSFSVDCKSQEEVDHFWNAFAEGGETMACGWVSDRFGVTWQVIPTVLIELMNDPDREKAQRVVNAMLQMQKIDIAALEEAYGGVVGVGNMTDDFAQANTAYTLIQQFRLRQLLYSMQNLLF
jgi:predicted 3-demethylubiquinone-9 3-methyltransferase (glyoxalase superfamily)